MKARKSLLFAIAAGAFLQASVALAEPFNDRGSEPETNPSKYEPFDSSNTARGWNNRSPQPTPTKPSKHEPYDPRTAPRPGFNH